MLLQYLTRFGTPSWKLNLGGYEGDREMGHGKERVPLLRTRGEAWVCSDADAKTGLLIHWVIDCFAQHPTECSAEARTKTSASRKQMFQ